MYRNCYEQILCMAIGEFTVYIAYSVNCVHLNQDFLLSLLLPNYTFPVGIEVEASLLYFSNISNIQYYNRTGSNTRVVFDNLGYGEALECNLCDHKIYWIDLPGMIKRGDPNDPASVETVSPQLIND